MTGFRLEFPPIVANVLRHLPPETKQPIKAALRAISAAPTIGEPLQRDLAGLLKYRVRRYRIVYEIDRRARVVRVVGIGPRHRVYDDIIEATRR